MLRTIRNLLAIFAFTLWIATLLKKLFGGGSGRSGGRHGVFAGVTWRGKVTRVIDGDTVMANFGKGEVRVRLAHIDAPEHDQEGGAEATAWFNSVLEDSTKITAKPIELDAYGRVVADLYLGREWINHWLVRDGMAWALPGDNDRDIADAQMAAQQQHIGIWRKAYPTPPWLWRKQHEAQPAY